jgi:hypothetical protein
MFRQVGQGCSDGRHRGGVNGSMVDGRWHGGIALIVAENRLTFAQTRTNVGHPPPSLIKIRAALYFAAHFRHFVELPLESGGVG